MAHGIDILAIGNKKKALPNKDNVKFASLDEYTSLAKKTISAYGNTVRPGLSEEMLRNDDAIANIAHAIMMADWVFDGRGSIHGFRKQRTLWALQAYVGRSTRKNKNKMLSLDNTLTQETGTFAENVVDTSETPEETVSRKEVAEKIRRSLKNAAISELAYKYIVMHYFQGKSMTSIAKERGVSKQSVHDLITRSITEIKNSIPYDNFFRSIINSDD